MRTVASRLSKFKDALQSRWPLLAGKPWSSMWSSPNWLSLVLADGADEVDPVPISDVRIADRGPRRPGGDAAICPAFSDISDIVNRAVFGITACSL